MMKTEELLNKYFDGETSRDEERELKRRFKEKTIPDDLEIYRPFFAYFDEETKQIHSSRKSSRPKSTLYKYVLYAVSGVAASLLILVAGNGIYSHMKHRHDYVIIDGKRYTDKETIREYARMSFADVCFSQEEIFDSLFE